jgi:hypothetical protein
MSQKAFNWFSWSLFVGLSMMAAVVWANNLDWDVTAITAFSIFPLLGLVAWLVMAGHYYAGAVRIHNPELKKPNYYRQVTGYVVLGSILLHPALLSMRLFENGLGLPPNSYLSYVDESLKLAVVAGSFSLTLFLSFEIFERLKNRRLVKQYWWLVSVSQSLAMTLIWVHGLRLGSSLADGWFRILWIILGVALLPCIYIIHRADFQAKK